MNLLSPALTIILIVAAIFGGLVNAFGWVSVAILAVIGIAWLYLGLLKRPGDAAAT